MRAHVARTAMLLLAPCAAVLPLRDAAAQSAAPAAPSAAPPAAQPAAQPAGVAVPRPALDSALAALSRAVPATGRDSVRARALADSIRAVRK